MTPLFWNSKLSLQLGSWGVVGFVFFWWQLFLRKICRRWYLSFFTDRLFVGPLEESAHFVSSSAGKIGSERIVLRSSQHPCVWFLSDPVSDVVPRARVPTRCKTKWPPRKRRSDHLFVRKWSFAFLISKDSIFLGGRVCKAGKMGSFRVWQASRTLFFSMRRTSIV